MLDFFCGDTVLRPWPTPGGVRPHNTSDYWFSSLGSHTMAGVPVNEHTALNYSAIWCATRVLCETIGRLPKLVFERTPARTPLGIGGKRLARENPVFPIVNSEPNGAATSMPFFEGLSEPLINGGNTFAEIMRVGVTPSWLRPLHPSDIKDIQFAERGEPIYILRSDTAEDNIVLGADMAHVPGVLPGGGIWGKGVIRHARETIGLGLATEKYGSQFFASGGKPSGILKNPKNPNILNNAEEREAFLRQYKDFNSGSGTAILWKGFDYMPISISQEDAQFLQTRRFQIEEIARWYNLPPHVLKDMERATFSNIEQQAIDYIVYSVMPWVIRWEEQLTRKMFTPQQRERFFVEFNPDALLRGDLKSRYEAYAIGLLNGFLSINDVLRKENMNPIGPEGDGHRVPANTLPLGADRIADTAAELRKFVDGKTDDITDLLTAQGEALSEVLLPAVRDVVPAACEAVAKQMDELSMKDRLVIASEANEARYQCERVARITLRDAIARMIRKEAKAATRAATDSKTFLEKLDAFYAKHETQFADAIANGCEAAIAAGYAADSDAIAESETTASQLALIELYDYATPDEFADAVATEVATWDSRADEIVNRIFNTETVEA